MAVRRIQIAAADVALVRTLESALTRAAYAIAGVTSTARELVESVERTAPDLVLIDLSLGSHTEATDAASEIRRRWPIPVIFVTSETDDEMLRRAGIVEPFGYITKPVTDRELRINLELALCKYERAKHAHELEDRFFSINIDLLCFLDFNGHFKRLNPAWERTLGFTRQELMSRPFIEFVHPDDRERTLAQNRAVRGGGKALGFENRYLCKDGSYRWLLWNAAPDSDEHVIYSVARDITAHKEAEVERDRLVAELQAALAEVRELQEFLPICSYCRKIRDDENFWHSVESYITAHTKSHFSHGICPDCYTKEFEEELGARESA